MKETDETKTAFITEMGTFRYKRMPFGLKNAGATYQTLVDKMFRERLRKDMEVYIDDMEVYIDDMLVKSLKSSEHLADLQRTFDTLRSYGMKLNPEKCAFGVASGKFLGYLVSQRGIEAKKQVQRLVGRINALGSSEACYRF